MNKSYIQSLVPQVLTASQLRTSVLLLSSPRLHFRGSKFLLVNVRLQNKGTFLSTYSPPGGVPTAPALGTPSRYGDRSAFSWGSCYVSRHQGATFLGRASSQTKCICYWVLAHHSPAIQASKWGEMSHWGKGIATFIQKASSLRQWLKAPKKLLLPAINRIQDSYTQRGKGKALVPARLQRDCLNFSFPVVIHRWAWSGCRFC